MFRLLTLRRADGGPPIGRAGGLICSMIGRMTVRIAKFLVPLFACLVSLPWSANGAGVDVKVPTAVPSAILQGFDRNTWLLDDGSFLVEDRKRNLTHLDNGTYLVEDEQRDLMSPMAAIDYESDGRVRWKQEFGAGERLLRVSETENTIYMLLFLPDYKDHNRYEVGTYRLVRCDRGGACNNVKTFEQGIFDIAADGKTVWAVEFAFSETNYAVEVPPLVAHRSSLHHYYGPFELESYLFFGLRAIDVIPTGDLLGLFFASEAHDRNDYGIFKIANGKQARVGSYQRNWTPESYEPTCYWFLYVRQSEETICMIPPQKFIAIRRDGPLAGEFYSRIYPKRLADGRVLVAQADGQIREIHETVGK
jgi:hypothetical protein